MIEIVTMENSSYWDECVKKVSGYDPFYLSGYLRAFSIQTGEKPLLAIYSKEDDYAINAFFKRDISNDKHFIGKIDKQKYYDIISPYGYGGFFGKVTDEKQLIKEWNTYCQVNGFVSEFIRFNLFTDYKDYFDGKVEMHTHNVVRNLDISLDEMWMDFKSKVRRNVKKANSYGLKIILDGTGEYLGDFLRIYYDTMDRTGAAEEYYFSKKLFESLYSMKNNACFFFVKYEDRIISTELVLYGEENAYFFLGGTDQKYYPLRPNDFLKYEIIKWAKEKGLKNYVLGGGYGADDGIFQYKECLAPHGITDFYIGKKIIDKDIYQNLCRMRGIDDINSLEGFFPKYRSEI